MASFLWDDKDDQLFFRWGMSWINHSFLIERQMVEVSVTPTAWSPPVDIYETVDGLILSIELPGVGKDDVTVEFKDDLLVIRGERKFKHELRLENCHRMEGNYGPFQRFFTVPEKVDTSRLEAGFKDGTLNIYLPKGGKATKIAIEAGE